MVIQICLILFILFIIFEIFSRWRKKQIDTLAFLAWLIFWLAGIVIVSWPESTNFLARILGIGRGADVIIYFSIIIIFYFIFYFTIKLRKIDREITELVRKISFIEKK